MEGPIALHAAIFAQLCIICVYFIFGIELHIACGHCLHGFWQLRHHTALVVCAEIFVQRCASSRVSSAIICKPLKFDTVSYKRAGPSACYRNILRAHGLIDVGFDWGAVYLPARKCVFALKRARCFVFEIKLCARLPGGIYGVSLALFHSFGVWRVGYNHHAVFIHIFRHGGLQKAFPRISNFVLHCFVVFVAIAFVFVAAIAAAVWRCGIYFFIGPSAKDNHVFVRHSLHALHAPARKRIFARFDQRGCGGR